MYACCLQDIQYCPKRLGLRCLGVLQDSWFKPLTMSACHGLYLSATMRSSHSCSPRGIPHFYKEVRSISSSFEFTLISRVFILMHVQAYI